jgi:membrane associated rhomboid family serine protease
VRRLNLTSLLIAANVVVYIWLVTTGGLASNEALYDHGALLGLACRYAGQWWRIVSGAFLHGGILHIGMNMIGLHVLGNDVEHVYGTPRFALIYAIGMVGSGLAVVYFAPRDVTVGASGAIFALFGALFAIGVRLGSRGRVLITRMLPLLVVNLVLTFAIPNISAAGHVGGLITGFLAGLLLFSGVPVRRTEYAFAVTGGPEEPAPVETIEQAPVETIEQPPDAGPHEEEGAPPLEVRDPRE